MTSTAQSTGILATMMGVTGWSNEAAGVHHFARRRSRRVDLRPYFCRAAIGDGSDWDARDGPLHRIIQSGAALRASSDAAAADPSCSPRGDASGRVMVSLPLQT